MHLEGSCHCGSVKFSVTAHQPIPFMRCYCSICRKTAGGGGYAINLGADASTMRVTGKRHLRVYQAQLHEEGKPPHTSSGRRHFCGRCGSALWLFDPQWPELIHPHASAIDTPLPVPPHSAHIMLGSKAGWVAVEGKRGDTRFDAYPDFSLAEWHERHAPKTSPKPAAKAARKSAKR
ncbi:GFA family protein [Pseudorhodoferax sp. Leaf267]|uniref:GFA family protein n=1 Tax=Pseudorhodoferax sp. Leaf267 TaxID=1736316 RepID=UPI0006FAA3CB|nr:GFA family protein [Pseudorhodoferax sp. Leaf267]KQP19239.1 alanine acetyltransferase [Pseudorhodoferax sp. Leaf267]